MVQKESREATHLKYQSAKGRIASKLLPFKICMGIITLVILFSDMESNGLIGKLTDLGVESKYLNQSIQNFRLVYSRRGS